MSLFPARSDRRLNTGRAASVTLNTVAGSNSISCSSSLQVVPWRTIASTGWSRFSHASWIVAFCSAAELISLESLRSAERRAAKEAPAIPRPNSAYKKMRVARELKEPPTRMNSGRR